MTRPDDRTSPEPPAPRRAKVGPRIAADSQPRGPGVAGLATTESATQIVPGVAASTLEIQLPASTFLSVVFGLTREVIESQAKSSAASPANVLDRTLRIVKEHQGQEVVEAGNEILAWFRSPDEAIATAIELQTVLSNQERLGNDEPPPRIGVHTGVTQDSSIPARSVSAIRARGISAAAHVRQILISEATALAIHSIPEGVQLKDLGFHRLKDLGQPERLFQMQIAGMESTFPELYSLANPDLPNNLPARLSSFIGRGQELSTIQRLLTTSRLLTLTGPGGTGKTRLALQVAAELLNDQEEGVWLVELANLSDSEQVAPAVANALRVHPEGGGDLLDVLVESLQEQRILLVLDNCEHLVDACAKLSETILYGCTEVRILATSRETLNIDGEVIYRVPSMALPPIDSTDVAEVANSEAVRLFIERVRLHTPNFVLSTDIAPTITSICTRLDAMPLAIELAAARLRSMPLEELNKRLDQRFDLLVGGRRTASPRQQTLTATVAWSYEMLNVIEQQFLQVLSVFSGSFDIVAAQSVAEAKQLADFQILTLLSSLVDKSLVCADLSDSGAIRYRLLETIRQYVNDEILQTDGPRGVEDLRQAHSKFYLDFVENAQGHLNGHLQAQWFAMFDREYDNIRAALSYERARSAGASTVMKYAAGLGRYWFLRGNRAEALPIFQELVQSAEIEALTEVNALVLFHYGFLIDESGFGSGESAFRRCAAISEAIGRIDLAATAMAFVGFSARIRGDAEMAEAISRDAITRAEASGNTTSLAYALMLQAESRDSLEKGLTLFESMADAFGCVCTLINLANLSLLEGDALRTVKHSERGLELAESLGWECEELRGNLAFALYEVGEVTRARAEFRRLLRASYRHLHNRGIGFGLLGLALCQEVERIASELHGAAAAQFERIDAVLDPAEERIATKARTGLRASLGEAAFSASFEVGHGLSLSEAFSLACS